MWHDLKLHLHEVESYLELLEEGESVEEDAILSLETFNMFIGKVEIQKLLSEPEDHLSAILTIHPGAGGTESQDWASMLYRLYIRWCEKHNYKTNLYQIHLKMKLK